MGTQLWGWAMAAVLLAPPAALVVRAQQLEAAWAAPEPLVVEALLEVLQEVEGPLAMVGEVGRVTLALAAAMGMTMKHAR